MLENNPDKEPSGTLTNGSSADSKEFKVSLAGTKNGKRKHDDNDFEEDEDLENKANGHSHPDDKQKEKVGKIVTVFLLIHKIFLVEEETGGA